jgi:hypothetical protein
MSLDNKCERIAGALNLPTGNQLWGQSSRWIFWASAEKQLRPESAFCLLLPKNMPEEISSE